MRGREHVWSNGERAALSRRITRQPFKDWLTADEGTAAVQTAAHRIGFALFGRVRAARRRMYRELWEAVATPVVRDAIAAECGRYPAAWAELAYAPSLPRANVALHRLVVVPRTMILARTLSGVTRRLAACPGLRHFPIHSKRSADGSFARWIARSGAPRRRFAVRSILGTGLPPRQHVHGSIRCGPGRLA
jgi:hypothetical protein